MSCGQIASVLCWIFSLHFHICVLPLVLTWLLSVYLLTQYSARSPARYLSRDKNFRCRFLNFSLQLTINIPKISFHNFHCKLHLSAEHTFYQELATFNLPFLTPFTIFVPRRNQSKNFWTCFLIRFCKILPGGTLRSTSICTVRSSRWCTVGVATVQDILNGVNSINIVVDID